MVIDYLGKKTIAFYAFLKKNKQNCQGTELRKQKFYSILLVIKILILWRTPRDLQKSLTGQYWHFEKLDFKI